MPGWINADRSEAAGLDVRADIRDGLPLDAASMEYAVAIHALQDMAWADIPAAVRELHRVLEPGGGVLRLGLPDLERAIDAYNRGDARYFYVPDEHARSLGAKLITQIIWYGSVRTPFTYDYAAELLSAAGFRRIVRCEYGATRAAMPRSRRSTIVRARACSWRGRNERESLLL